jgi:serine/threonine-protein kinase
MDEQDGDTQGYLKSAEALAAVYDYTERYLDSERLFRELVERTRKIANDRDHGRALAQLGINLEFQGRCTDATPFLNQGIELLARIAPEEPALDGAYNALGNCAHRARQFEDALRNYEHALALRRKTLGLEHPRTAILQHNLAVVLMELGRKKEALAHAKAAVDVRARSLPADHPWRRESEALYTRLGGTLSSVRVADGG